MKGASTGMAPPQVRRMNTAVKDQNISLLIKLNLEFIGILLVIGKTARIIIEITRARTPPNLFGIDRRIAYANKKYHSG
jgi:hypothetical protein